MSTKKRKTAVVAIVSMFVLGVFAGVALCKGSSPAPDSVLKIRVSPDLIVKGATVGWFTVHTNVLLKDVTADSWTMNVEGTTMDEVYVYSDDSGRLVAQVPFADVEEAVSCGDDGECGEATITLTLEHNSVVKSASEDVRVKCPVGDTFPDEDGDFNIFLAPHTIDKSHPSEWLTVKTDVPLEDVMIDLLTGQYCVSLEVNGEEMACYVYADDLGNLVIKTPFEDVVAEVSYPSATIKLELVDINGDNLEASVIVEVSEPDED